MNTSAPLLFAVAESEIPAWVHVAIPVVGLALGLMILTAYAEQSTRRSQNQRRRPYRFRVNAHETGRANTPTGDDHEAPTTPRKTGAQYAAASVARDTVREAIAEARQAMNPKTAEKPPVTTAPMPLRDPKRLAPAAAKKIPAGRVELAPTGFWIGAGTAPNGSIIVYRWHDGSRRHEGRVTFAPTQDTGGHFVHTGAKPVQVTLVGFEAPR